MNARDLPDVVWIKSLASANNCACVEIAVLDDGDIGVRDSKDQDGPALVFTPVEWDAFLEGAKNGQFDRDKLATSSR